MMVAQDGDARHDVLFAEGDDELMGVAGDRLAGALAAGSVAVVIATPEHRRGFAERISAAGVDPDSAGDDGALLMLDAAETLDRLMLDGAFDPEAFAEVVGSVVRSASDRAPVHAFGEMVGLLWDVDRPQQAIELEAAWDELVRQTSASLLCAYPGSLVDDGERSAELAVVCGMHSAVLSAAPFERLWRFPVAAAAASDARRLSANALRTRGIGESTFYDTQSVLTELVVNAVSHAGSPFSVGITVDDARVLVRVADDSTDAPVLKQPVSGPGAGRGLRLVDTLADRWGVERHDSGKVVWAELSR